ncbi:MAG TPA: MFS transporter [Azospirillaceae bacterium]|nr:MFS transporter [Azospirillaceae bacterium]
MTTDAHDPTRRNVFLLALCQALGQTGMTTVIVGAGLVGHSLAEDKSLATLPLAFQFVGTMLSTIPASLLMGRIGRRNGFTIGAGIGIAGALLSAWAIFSADFWTFLAGHVLLGFQMAFINFYRFAAADTARPDFKSRAISLVLTGAVVAAIAGPELAKLTRDLFAPALFAGAYIVIAGLQGLTLAILRFLRIPTPTAEMRREGGRPLGEILRQPTFAVAVFTGAVGFGTMTLVMTATPLAILAGGHHFADAAFVIQWHVLGMYAPSFFTGGLIRRFGCTRIITAGALLNFCCLIVNLSGAAVLNFWGGLVLLGVGWNFMYIGATTLLTECERPAERAKVQAANDFIVFTTVSAASFLSGALHSAFGWQAVNLAVAPLVAAALGATVWLGTRRAVRTA